MKTGYKISIGLFVLTYITALIPSTSANALAVFCGAACFAVSTLTYLTGDKIS